MTVTATCKAISAFSPTSAGCSKVERTALSDLARILRALSIHWTLIGALAANRYRTSPRLTQDVDLLLADVGPGLEILEAELSEAGWQVRRADAEGELLRLRHPQLGVADLLIAGTDYQQEALARAREESIIGGERISVLTPEDVIVHKLIAGRSQDIADIEAIIAARVPLDESYIDRWTRFWDVFDRWTELRRG
jgi:predicted nucleotidyltransferase